MTPAGYDVTSVVQSARERRLAARVGLVAGSFIFAVILQWAYAEIVAPTSARIGYVYDPPALGTRLGFAAIAALLAATLPVSIKKPADITIWLLYVITAVPSLTIPVTMGIVEMSHLASISAAIATSWILIVSISRFGLFSRAQPIRLPQSFLWVALAAVTICTYGALYSSTGLTFSLAALEEVRDVRLDYRDSLKSLPAIVGYLVTAQSNVINPLFIAVGLRFRNGLAFLSGIIGQVLIYGATGYRMTLLSIPAIILLYFLIKTFRNWWPLVLLPAISLLILLAVYLNLKFGHDTLGLILVTRLLATPGVLTAAHITVFDDYGFINWSLISRGLTGEYNLPLSPSFMVGWAFSNDPEVSANANLFADGYMQAGIPGILTEGAIAGLLLLIMNLVLSRWPLWLSTAILFTPSIALSNTGVFSALLTHGFLLIVLIAVCFELGDKDHMPGTRQRKVLSYD